MRYMIGSELGWIAVPVIVVVGAAFVWVADRLLVRKPQTGTREHSSSVSKAA